MESNVLSPYELHCGFAKSAICKYRGSTFSYCPGNQGFLKVEKRIRHENWIKAMISARMKF